MSPRRIAVVTGIRSEYDILYSSLRAIEEHPELELALVVTGAHLSDLHGRTVREIESDGFPIAERVQSLLGSDTSQARAQSVGIQIAGLAQAFARLRPDVVVAPCDREEALATATAALYLGLPVAHLYGGDRTESGIVDEQVRHATTKLSHLHLVMNEEHGKRVQGMGEEPWRIHVVGHGGLDRLLATPELSRKELGKRLGTALPEGGTVLVLQHSMTNDIERAGAHMRTTLEGVRKAGLTGVVIHPNADVGNLDAVRVIGEFVEENEGWIQVANLPRLEFVNLLRHADVLVGNSTTGIQEAPLLALPAVNVGPRQRGRQHGDNVLFVDHDVDAVVEGIRRALGDPSFRRRLEETRNPFGDGKTGPRVARILAEVDLGPDLLEKGMTL